uniref:ditrans,polycis-polyprenyl diphosphate synthase [(2E,6E)-farnesyldiphosphate specific] n=1 Tax=Mesocestoides corti TaxID=53468 RepID=A0A5K3EGJ9_MESCO
MHLKVAFWRFLHTFTLIFYAFAAWLYAEIFDIKYTISRFWNGGMNSTDAPCEFLESPFETLNHIAFVIYEDNLSVPILCQLILICVHLQIKEVSVTVKSASKSCVKRLAHSYLQTCSNVFCSEPNSSKEVQSLSVSSKGRNSNIYFLDIHTGQQLMLSAAKSLSSSSKASLTTSAVEKTLHGIFPVSPVSLTVIFGPPSLIGLLPWQSGTTEILKWPSHKCINSSDFAKLLRVYSGISQRWGR